MTFGEFARDALREAKRKGEVSWEQVADIIQATYLQHCSANRREAIPLVKYTGVDPLFEAICRAEGSSPDQMTADGKRAAAIALGAIKKACPRVSVQDIQNAAREYSRQFSGASITANALARHWGRIHRPKPAGHTTTAIPPEPLDWQTRLATLRPGHAAISKPWPQLPPAWHKAIIELLAEQEKAAHPEERAA